MFFFVFCFRKFIRKCSDGRTDIFRTDDGRTNGIFSAGRPDGRNMFGRSDGTGGRKSFGHPDARTPERTDGRTKNKTKSQSVSQTIDLVVTIKTHTGSSKSELSSRGKRPFEVFRLWPFFPTDGIVSGQSKMRKPKNFEWRFTP